MWAVVEDNEVIRVITKPTQSVRGTDGVLRPPSLLTKSEPTELRAVGIYPVIQVDQSNKPLHRLTSKPVYTITATHVEQEWETQPMLLEEAKELVRKTINIKKQKKQDGNFVFGENEFQCNARSRDFILGRALDAFIAINTDTSFAKDFTDANNISHTLDASETIALARAAAEHIETWHEWAQDLKTQVQSATSVDELEDLLETVLNV